MIVLDASAVLARALKSQATPAADALIGSKPIAPFIAPAILPFEVRNALIRAERRGLTDQAGADEAALLCDALVELRPWDGATAAFARLMRLARAHMLSLFDASYLDLAVREGAALASRDGALIDAAGREGLRVHDLR